MNNFYHSKPKGVISLILIIGIVAVLAAGTGIVIYTIQNKEGGLLNIFSTNNKTQENQQEEWYFHPFKSSDGKWGYKDVRVNKIVIEPQYDEATEFYEGLAAVRINGKWGFIDKTGKIVVKPQYDRVENFYEGVAAVEIKNKWGFIDKTGKIVIEPQYDGVGDFHEGSS